MPADAEAGGALPPLPPAIHGLHRHVEIVGKLIRRERLFGFLISESSVPKVSTGFQRRFQRLRARFETVLETFLKPMSPVMGRLSDPARAARTPPMLKNAASPMARYEERPAELILGSQLSAAPSELLDGSASAASETGIGAVSTDIPVSQLNFQGAHRNRTSLRKSTPR